MRGNLGNGDNHLLVNGVLLLLAVVILAAGLSLGQGTQRALRINPFPGPNSTTSTSSTSTIAPSSTTSSTSTTSTTSSTSTASVSTSSSTSTTTSLIPNVVFGVIPSSATGTQSISVNGQVCPTPSNGGVTIIVKAPNGNIVKNLFTGISASSSCSSFSTSFTTGGGANWTNGTYPITANYLSYYGSNSLYWTSNTPSSSTTSSSTTITVSSTSTTTPTTISSGGSSTTTIFTSANVYVGVSPQSIIGFGALSIFGSVSPVATPPGNVLLSVKSPNNKLVGNFTSGLAISGSYGSFSGSLYTGTNANWTNGTYTVTANYYGFTGSNTFAWHAANSLTTTTTIPANAPSTATSTIPYNGINTATSTTSIPYNGINTTTRTTSTIPYNGVSTTTRTTTIYPTNIVPLNFSTNVVYANTLPIANYSSVNSIPKGVVLNISATIGVPITSVANSIANAVNGIPIRFACLSCNGTTNVPPNGIIEGFVLNTTIANSTFVKKAIASNVIQSNSIANIGGAIAQNQMLLKQLVSNYTPSGFSPLSNTSVVVKQNATTYRTQWAAQSSTASAYVNVSVFKTNNAITINSIPPGQRAVIPYIKSAFNTTNVTNRTTVQQVYITQLINSSKTVVKYVPTNVTVYKSSNATVIGVTNLANNVNHYVTIPKTTVIISNVSLSVKNNQTLSVIAIKTYPSNTTSIKGKRLPILPGTTASYLLVNSTINDSNIKSLNYTFNITISWAINNRIDPRNLSMYRLNASTGAWTKLNTTLVYSNATNIVYRAKSPGLSVYAVSGGVFIIPPPSTTIINATTTVPQAAPQQTNWPLIIAVLVLVIVALVYYFLPRIMSSSQEPPPVVPPPPPPPQSQ